MTRQPRVKRGPPAPAVMRQHGPTKNESDVARREQETRRKPATAAKICDDVSLSVLSSDTLKHRRVNARGRELRAATTPNDAASVVLNTKIRESKPRCQSDVEEFAAARVRRACTQKLQPQEIAQPMPTGTCPDVISSRCGADDRAKSVDLPEPSTASKEAVNTVDVMTPEQAIMGGSASEPVYEHISTDATGRKCSTSTDVMLKDEWKHHDQQRCFPGLLGSYHSD